MQHLLNYVLQLADNTLVIGHRLSEWAGHGPVLEQDIALSNIALDHIGAAISFYQYSGELFNHLPEADKKNVFSSVVLKEKINSARPLDEDDLAYLRDGWDFKNVILTELPNKDWAFTVARSFFLDVFHFYFYTALSKSEDLRLAGIAEKALKEATYHVRWSSEWVIRLGDGTAESKQKMQQALNDTWSYTGELFKPSPSEKVLIAADIAPDLQEIKAQWEPHVSNILNQATLEMPANTWMQQGGKAGIHSEHLGYMLAEMQFMQRAYPGMEW